MKLALKALEEIQLVSNESDTSEDDREVLQTIHQNEQLSSLHHSPDLEVLNETVNQYIYRARDVITIYFVTLSPKSKFIIKGSSRPLLVHQVFPEEIIMGYKNLSIALYYDIQSLNVYIKVKYTAVLSKMFKIKRTDIVGCLESWLPFSYTFCDSQFKKYVRKTNQQLYYGKTIQRFNVVNRSTKQCENFFITRCKKTQPGFFRFHERFESLIVWYIDAANKIDLYESNWIVYYLYLQNDVHQLKSRVITEVKPVGFCTAYRFYAHPNKIRIRLSQFFVLPIYQRRGLGTRFLKSLYKTLLRNEAVVDIQIEDPCSEFQRMRDIVDCQLYGQLDCLKPPMIYNGLTPQVYAEMSNVIKINQKQCTRIYKILLMFYLTQNRIVNNNFSPMVPDEFEKYLTLPYQGVYGNRRIRNSLSDLMQVVNEISNNRLCFNYEYTRNFLAVVNYLHTHNII